MSNKKTIELWGSVLQENDEIGQGYIARTNDTQE